MELKELIEILLSKKQIFKSIFKLDLKKVRIRKKMDIFVGVNIQSFYVLIIVAHQKSRFIMQHSKEILDIRARVVDYQGHNFKYSFLIVKNEICSKSKIFLKENNFKVIKL